jgi:hypothetical protein
VLFVIVLLRSIFMFTKFDTVWLMAGEGGVSRYVRTPARLRLRAELHVLQAGHGRRAGAVLMFLLLLGATLVYFRAFRDEARGVRRALVLYAGGLVAAAASAPSRWPGCSRPAFKPSGEIFATPPTLMPKAITLENFSRLFSRPAS